MDDITMECLASFGKLNIKPIFLETELFLMSTLNINFFGIQSKRFFKVIFCHAPTTKVTLVTGQYPQDSERDLQHVYKHQLVLKACVEQKSGYAYGNNQYHDIFMLV
jgi:hypothetical protein